MIVWLETLLIGLTVVALALQGRSCRDARRRWQEGRLAHPAAVALAYSQYQNGIRRVVYSGLFVGLAGHLWVIPPPPPDWAWALSTDLLVLVWLNLTAATSARTALAEQRSWRNLDRDLGRTR